VFGSHSIPLSECNHRSMPCYLFCRGQLKDLEGTWHLAKLSSDDQRFDAMQTRTKTRSRTRTTKASEPCHQTQTSETETQLWRRAYAHPAVSRNPLVTHPCRADPGIRSDCASQRRELGRKRALFNIPLWHSKLSCCRAEPMVPCCWAAS